MQTTMTKNEMSSIIVKNELAIMRAIKEGHRPHISDEYQSLRIEIELLRCMYFGEDSPHCRRQYRR